MKMNRAIAPILTLKLVAIAKSTERSNRSERSELLSKIKCLLYGGNLVKIGQVDPDITCQK